MLGASGFIGSYLTKQLSSQANIIGYDLVPPCNDSYEFVQGDFPTENNFEYILKTYKIDVIFHLISTTTPMIGTSRVTQEISENIIPTINLLESMKNTGTKRIIFTSSGGTVYGESRGHPSKCEDLLYPICSYGVQKLAIEQYFQLYNHLYDLVCIVARISNPYGAFLQEGRTQGIIPIFLLNLLSGKPITLYGETVRDYIHISDVINVLISLGFYKGKQRVFNVATGVPTRLDSLVHTLENIAKKEFVAVNRHGIRACDVYENVLNINDTIRELNWKPIISLEDGISMTLKEIVKSKRWENK